MVKVGDTIAAEQSLITVEGDKASMEVPAPFAGTVKEIKINTGDKVSTGSLIMIFEVAGAAPAGAPKRKPLRLLLLQLQVRKTLTYRISAAMKLK
jgi:pyruvate dehydrogenase E2 component (dihydrolipoamide acetyltransferase)